MGAIKYDDPFKLILEQLNLVRQENAEIKQQLQVLSLKQEEDKYLSIDETRRMWQPAVSRPTIYAWCDAGQLIKHTINGKSFFLLSEIKAAVKTIKRFSPISK